MTRVATLEAVEKWKVDLDNKTFLPNGHPIPVVLLANKVCVFITIRHNLLPVFNLRLNFRVTKRVCLQKNKLNNIVVTRVLLAGFRRQQKRMLV